MDSQKVEFNIGRHAELVGEPGTGLSKHDVISPSTSSGWQSTRSGWQLGLFTRSSTLH